MQNEGLIQIGRRRFVCTVGIGWQLLIQLSSLLNRFGKFGGLLRRFLWKDFTVECWQEPVDSLPSLLPDFGALFLVWRRQVAAVYHY